MKINKLIPVLFALLILIPIVVALIFVQGHQGVSYASGEKTYDDLQVRDLENVQSAVWHTAKLMDIGKAILYRKYWSYMSVQQI